MKKGIKKSLVAVFVTALVVIAGGLGTVVYLSVQNAINNQFYTVKFVQNGEVLQDQTVQHNHTATVPNFFVADKDGYDFDGWTIDGENLVDPTTVKITADTTFRTVYTKLHAVTFIYEGTTIATQNVRDHEFATQPETMPANTKYKVFNGWRTGNQGVTLSNYAITEPVTLVAALTYYQAVRFVDKDEQQIDLGLTNDMAVYNSTLNVPTAPVIDGYVFDGWSDSEGGKIVLAPDATTVTVTADVTYYANYTKTYVVTFVNDNTTVDAQTVRIEQTAVAPDDQPAVEKDGKTYPFLGWTADGVSVFDMTTPVTADVTLHALFGGCLVDVEWTFVDDNKGAYVVGDYVWQDHEGHTYLSMHYAQFDDDYLLTENNTWVKVNFNDPTDEHSYFDANCIGCDNQYTYYISKAGRTSNGVRTILTQSATATEDGVWAPSEAYSSCNGNTIWSDGSTTYIANGNRWYILTVENGVPVIGRNLPGNYAIWNVGTNYFACNPDWDNKFYVMTKGATADEDWEWQEITFTGWTTSSYFDSKYIWSDGTNIYYGDYNAQYVLSKVDLENGEFVWSESPLELFDSYNQKINIDGSCIWHNGNQTYYNDKEFIPLYCPGFADDNH